MIINLFRKTNLRQCFAHSELSRGQFRYIHMIDYNVLVKDDGIAVGLGSQESVHGILLKGKGYRIVFTDMHLCKFLTKCDLKGVIKQ